MQLEKSVDMQISSFIFRMFLYLCLVEYFLFNVLNRFKFVNIELFLIIEITIYLYIFPFTVII